MPDNSAFISYRRSTGYAWARLIWDELQERSLNVFLDLETMRQAGRFDHRILNQIAARPYFIVVLTEGTLERCSSPDDWVRREIEYAIEVDRIVVPLFIAPFQPSQFPPDLPPEIAEVLSNSNGVTFYSEFIGAAFDQLEAYLAPIDRATLDLTDDDAEFERRAVDRIRAEPLPAPVLPAAAPGSSTPTDQWPPDPPPSDASTVDQAPVGRDSPEQGSTDASVADDSPAPPPGTPSSPEPMQESPSHPRADGAGPGDAGDEGGPDDGDDDSEVPPIHPVGGVTGHPRTRWLLAGAAAVVLVVGVVALALAGGGNDEVADPDGPGTSIASKPPGSDEDHDTVVDADGPHSVSTAGGNVFITADSPVVSETGDHRLVMTSGGRLELRTGDDVVWTPTYFSPPVAGAVAILQESDGNLVVYPVPEPTADDPALWAIGEQPGTDVELRVFDDDGWGVVAVFRDDREIWRRGGAPSEQDQGSTTASDPDVDTTAATDAPTNTEDPTPSTTEPPFATPSDLDGGSFVASSIEGRSLVDPTDLTMSFDGDRISYNGGCNTTQSRYELEAGVLGLVGPGASTLIACDAATSEQDRWFSELLGADPTLTLVDELLVVSDDDTTIEFRSIE